MMRRRALVTGATGGLGRHLVSKLVNAGYIVRASGRNAHIGQSLLKPNVEFVSGDLNDEGLPSRLAADTDVVFHCAALSSPWGRKEDFVRSNITATQVLVDAALANRCTSFVHVSTPSIYFRYQDQLGIPENAPLPGRFVNAYAETKAEAETVVRRAGGAGLRATIIRPRGIFGEHDTVLIPRLLKVVRNGLMPVFNNGNAIVDEDRGAWNRLLANSASRDDTINVCRTQSCFF
jgi:nucleoside-diphosphate-sugar epimerase